MPDAREARDAEEGRILWLYEQGILRYFAVGELLNTGDCYHLDEQPDFPGRFLDAIDAAMKEEAER